MAVLLKFNFIEVLQQFLIFLRIIFVSYASGIIGITERMKHLVESKYLKRIFKGEIIDWDDNWIVMQTETKKNVSKKIFRTDNISSVKEIIE